MLKITSFSALIAGLLLAVPLVFNDAEASRTDMLAVAPKADRELADRQANDRIAAAFKLVDVCSRDAAGDSASWCTARHAELSRAADTIAASTVTVETRDEATQTSTLASVQLMQ